MKYPKLRRNPLEDECGRGRNHRKSSFICFPRCESVFHEGEEKRQQLQLQQRLPKASPVRTVHLQVQPVWNEASSSSEATQFSFAAPKVKKIPEFERQSEKERGPESQRRVK